MQDILWSHFPSDIVDLKLYHYELGDLVRRILSFATCGRYSEPGFSTVGLRSGQWHNQPRFQHRGMGGHEK